MEFRHLQYFTTIARLGGFRRAAEELDISQATLSEQIKTFEQALGVRLLERGGRTVSLTEAGQVLYERAERIIAEVNSAQAEMREFADLGRGQLTLGAIPGLGAFWLAEFLSAFLCAYPGVDLRLVEGSSARLFELLESHAIHAACVLVPTEDSQVPQGIAHRTVATGELVAVVSRRHRLAQRARVGLDELAGERLVLTSVSEAPRLVVDRAFRAEGIEPSVWFEADDPATLLGLVADGVAVGITGKGIARRNADRVVAMEIEGPRLRYSPALAWSERGPTTRALRTFLQFAISWLTRRDVAAYEKADQPLAAMR